MISTFELPVMFKEEELLIPVQLHQYGYVYKIEATVNGVVVFFERDEEGSWRALGDASLTHKSQAMTELVQAIIRALDGLEGS
jgi:hypothetical protein